MFLSSHLQTSIQDKTYILKFTYLTPVWFLIFSVVLEFIDKYCTIGINVTCHLGVQSSLLSINICNVVFHIKNFFRCLLVCLFVCLLACFALFVFCSLFLLVFACCLSPLFHYFTVYMLWIMLRSQ
jgi:hypothetical protein